MSLLHRLVHRYDNEGLRGLRVEIFRSLRAWYRKAPAPTCRPGGAADFSHPFDRANDADTSGFISGAELATAPLTPGKPDFYNTAYYAISPSTLRQAIERLPQGTDGLRGFTFVDLGCGKGRALLVAAAYGFRQIVGVELSGDLVRIAETNTAAHPRVLVQQGDAAEFRYPETPLVIFLYHPFLAPVLKRVLRNLERQYRSKPRKIYLLYANPSYFRVMARCGFLRQVWDYVFALSEEDAAADRHGITSERFALYATDGTHPLPE